MKTVLAIALSLALPAVAAKEEMQIRNQGVVKAKVWLAAADLEGARVNLRVLTALSNDATAWNSRQAGALLKDAKEDLTTARTHARSLKSLRSKDAPEDLTRLDANLGTAIALVDKLQAPVARGATAGHPGPSRAIPGRSFDSRRLHSFSQTISTCCARSAQSDSLANAWYDASGNENGDKCIWKFGSAHRTAGAFPWMFRRLRRARCARIRGGSHPMGSRGIAPRLRV